MPPRPRSRVGLLWRLLEGERGRYLAAIGCTLAAAIFGYGTPLAVQALLDGVLAPDEAEAAGAIAPAAAAVLDLLGGREFVAEHLWVIAAFVGVTAGLAGICLFGRAYLSATACQQAVRRLRERLHAHLQRLPSAFFRRSESGDLLQRLTSDVETVQNFLASQVVEMGRSIALLLAALPLMLATDVAMTGLSLVLMPFVLAFAVLYFKRIRRTFLLKDEAEGRLTARRRRTSPASEWCDRSTAAITSGAASGMSTTRTGRSTSGSSATSRSSGRCRTSCASRRWRSSSRSGSAASRRARSRWATSRSSSSR